MKQSKTYWKDIFQSFSSSKGRVISIVSLMTLGSFALVGLKVTAPDIRLTGEHFLEKYNTADLFVISDYGLNDSDIQLLDQLDDKATVEYGYFTDATIGDTNQAFRLFSSPETLSQYEVVSGTLPAKSGEIALSDAYSDEYKIGETVTFEEKSNTQTGDVLRTHSFKIVGFVNSSELLSRINLGQSTAGTGNLKGYAVVTEGDFDSEVYMIARVGYDNLDGLNPFEQTYLDRVYDDKKEVQALFNLQPEEKLAALTKENQSKIDDGYEQLNNAKNQLTNAKNQIADGETQIADAQGQIENGQAQITDSENQLASAQTKLSQGDKELTDSYYQLQSAQAQLSDGWSQLASSQTVLENAARQIADAESTLAQKKAELDSAQAQISAAKSQLASTAATLSDAKTQLDQKAAELATAKTQLDQANAAIQAAKSELEEAKSALAAQIASLQAAGIDPSTVAEIVAAQEAIAQKEAELAAAQASYDSNLAAYQAGLALWEQKNAEYQAGVSQYQAAQSTLAEKEAQYQAGLEQYEAAVATLTAKKVEYEAGLNTYNTAYRTLTDKQNQYNSGLATYEASLNQYISGLSQLESAKVTLATKQSQLEEAKATLAQKKKEYEEAKAKADPEIADKEKELQEAQEKVNQLTLPTYQVYTRREVPGSEGYISYENNASIIDAVGNIFPIVLYFVASLVTFTTMARFVDEERLKAGTFKALGYTNQDIVRKFVIYGSITSLTGTAIGTLLGHTLLPYIIYTTYSAKIILKPIELHFYPWQTLVAVLLGLLSAVLPTLIVARKELSEKPAQLLLPKPPVSGSKIFLERLTFIWKRLTFTQKVTARNIFRYKQRMLMTIFGVCGSIALLFTGLGVRASVADLNNRQFNDIIKYDMIVAKNTYLSQDEEDELTKFLESSKIERSMDIHYEKVTKVAGNKNDTQSVTLIIPETSSQSFRDYINLVDRSNQKKLELSDDGAIISEKFANLTGAKVGDTITVQDSNDEDVRIKVAGISEMYMNHFMFMSEEYYQEVFGKSATKNALLVDLVNSSESQTNAMAADFMALSSVQSVVQNTALKEQVKIIVNSINRVMYILIITSALLAIVILYNLTNINVAERMRELCTIKVLGFHNQEVTMYIYRETIILSLLGILTGFASGLLLHYYMIQIIPPEAVMFNPAVGYMIYLLPAILVITILTILGFVVTQWLKKVDMLEALKSVE